MVYRKVSLKLKLPGSNCFISPPSVESVPVDEPVKELVKVIKSKVDSAGNEVRSD